MGDDYTGPPQMPKRVLIPTEPGDYPTDAGITLEHDTQRDQWIIHLEDGLGGTRSAVLPPSIVDALAERVTAQRLLEPTGAQAQVTVVEYANLGDSAAFIRKPLAFDPHETVGHLLDRAHGLGQPYRYHQAGERIELQVIQETIPEVNTRTGITPLDF